MQSIPIHKLHERSELGLELQYFQLINLEKENMLGIHRDDYYIFILHESGKSKVMVDFATAEAEGPALLYILPGQVHHILSADNSTGYFLAIDTHLINEEYRAVFEQMTPTSLPFILNKVELGKFKQCIELISDRFADIGKPFSKPILFGMVSGYLGMIAEFYLQKVGDSRTQNSRPVQITKQFRTLLRGNFRTIKSPAEYAEKLNISLTYLNEVVKTISGFSVSYWIQHEIILEAKRLLYYTDLSLKEIATALGFADYTYFSRLFTKVTGNPAGKFRQSYR